MIWLDFGIWVPMARSCWISPRFPLPRFQRPHQTRSDGSCVHVWLGHYYYFYPLSTKFPRVKYWRLSKYCKTTTAFTRWWKCCGRRPHFPVGKSPTAAGTGTLFPWCLQWRLSFVGPAPAPIPLLGCSRSRLSLLNWNEDVAVGQLPVSGFLVRSGFVVIIRPIMCTATWSCSIFRLTLRVWELLSYLV